MTSREVLATRVIASRPIALLLSILALGAMLISLSRFTPSAIVSQRGIALESPSMWFSSPATSALINLATIGGIAAMMVWLNGTYSILRNFSITFTGLFLVMIASMPAVTCSFQGGTLLALAVIVAMALMYGSYGSPRDVNGVMLAFLIISAGMLCQYGFVVYLPVLMLGCVQMRVTGARAVLAATLGILAPWWILWGFCDTPWPQFILPDFTNPFNLMPTDHVVRVLVNVGLTLFVTIVTGLLNQVKIYSYNAKARAINGLLSVVSIVTAVVMLADYTNMAFYIPLMYVCAAFQVGHFFVINYSRRSYILMLALVAIYSGFWLWSLF